MLAAGWPEYVPGITVNRACGSSQQALDFAAAVMSGQSDLVVAGGVEMMSRVPLGAARQTGQPYGPRCSRVTTFSFNQGESAEIIAQRWGLSRTELDEFSVRLTRRPAAATDAGAFAGQIVPVDVNGTPFTVDEGVRRGSTAETLSGLKPRSGGRRHPRGQLLADLRRMPPRSS